MKKLTFWKSLFLLFALIVGTSTSWATDVTFVAGTDVSSTKTLTKDGITITVTDGTFSRTDNYRTYANNTMTISSSVGNITNIAFTFSGTYTGGWDTSYSPNAESWTSSSASGQARINQIVVTYTPAASYTINYSATNGSIAGVDGSSNPVADGASVAQGATVTLTATPNSGYMFSSWSVSGADSELSSTSTNPTTFTMGTADATVTANFTEIPKYTVTLGDDNTQLTEQIGGAGVTLPTRNAIGDYNFAGWSITNVSIETTTAPTIISTGAYHPTANITLYPIYTRSEGGSAPSAFSVGDTGNYAIVSAEQNGKYYALPTTPTVTSGKITAQEITVSEMDDVKYVTPTDASGFTWTIATATNGYTLSDGSNYIYHSNGGASGTNLAYGTSTTYTWAFTADGDYVTMAGMSGSTTNDRGMLFKGTTIGGYALSNKDGAEYSKIMILPISAGSTIYYLSNPVPPAVATPEIAVADNPFLFSTTATITCATEGATIKYSYDGENWSDYTTALTITETKTIYAKAIKGTDESTVAQVTATKNLAEPTVTVSGDLTLDLNGQTNVDAGTLTAAVTYNNVAVEGATVTWSGNNDAVATIDASTGAVTIKTTGEVTFTATYAGNSDYTEATDTKTVTVYNSKAPGTKDNPYTVAEVNDGTATGTAYVKGFVVGFFNGKNSDASLSGNSNVALSDDPTVIDGANTIAVQLPTGDIRNAWNIDDNYTIGAEIIVKGSIQGYFTDKIGVKSTSEIIPVSVPGKVTSVGYATFSWPYDVDFSAHNALRVYYIDNTDGEKARMAEVASKVVPANTGVLLRGEADSYKGNVTTGATPITGNLLTANTKVKTATADREFYIFANGGNGLGFYPIANATKLGAGKAYIDANDVPAGAKNLVISFDGETTGIANLNVDETANFDANAPMYNLAGQRVNKSYKGVVIVNGKKMLNK